MVAPDTLLLAHEPSQAALTPRPWILLLEHLEVTGTEGPLGSVVLGHGGGQELGVHGPKVALRGSRVSA